MVLLETVLLDLSLPFWIAKREIPTSNTNKFGKGVATSFFLALPTSMTWLFVLGNFLPTNHVIPMSSF